MPRPRRRRHRVRPRRPRSTSRPGRATRPTRWRGSSSTCGSAPGARVADLAAGTGKLTRLLTPLGADARRRRAGRRDARASCARCAPACRCVAATAEQLPFAGGALDAITVAQAFHWFDADRSRSTEFARVLRPGGRLGLVWNARDRSNDLVDQLWSIMDRVEKRAPWRMHERVERLRVRRAPGFGAAARGDVPPRAAAHPRARSSPAFRSVSHVAVLPPDEQERCSTRSATCSPRIPTRGRARAVAIPYRVDAYWCERR